MENKLKKCIDEYGKIIYILPHTTLESWQSGNAADC